MVSIKDHVVSIGSARREAPAQLGVGSPDASRAQYKQVCRSTKKRSQRVCQHQGPEFVEKETI